VLYLTYQR